MSELKLQSEGARSAAWRDMVARTDLSALTELLDADVTISARSSAARGRGPGTWKRGATGPPPDRYGAMRSSTPRFSSRPFAVALFATGFVSP